MRESDIAGNFSYSNAGFVLLGSIAEKIEGLSWEDQIQKRIFDPLEMKTAGFGNMASPGQVDAPWQHGFENGSITPYDYQSRGEIIRLLLAPTGRIHCSLEDYSKFILEHLKGARGETGLLSSSIMKRLHNSNCNSGYSGGWLTTSTHWTWTNGIALFHGGSNNFNIAYTIVAPKRNFAVVVMTNALHTDNLDLAMKPHSRLCEILRYNYSP